MDPPQKKHIDTSANETTSDVQLGRLRLTLDILCWLNVNFCFEPTKPDTREGAWRYGAEKVEDMVRLYTTMDNYRLKLKDPGELSNEEVTCLLDTALSALGILFVEERFKPLTPNIEAAASKYGFDVATFKSLLRLMLAHSGEKFERELKAGVRRDGKAPDWFQ